MTDYVCFGAVLVVKIVGHLSEGETVIVKFCNFLSVIVGWDDEEERVKG